MSELISNLGIDWKLIIAQIVNFSVLVFILTKFLYKPILKTLEERKKSVANSEQLNKDLHVKLNEAEQTKNEILKDAKTKSSEIIAETKEQAEILKKSLSETAEIEVKKIHQNAKKEISAEKDKAMNEVKKEIGSLLNLAITKSLGDVMDQATQEKLTSQAMDKIPTK